MVLSLIMTCCLSLPLFRWGPNSIFRRHRICSLSRILSWSSKLMTTCPCRKEIGHFSFRKVFIPFSLRITLISWFALKKIKQEYPRQNTSIMMQWCNPPPHTHTYIAYFKLRHQFAFDNQFSYMLGVVFKYLMKKKPQRLLSTS